MRSLSARVAEFIVGVVALVACAGGVTAPAPITAVVVTSGGYYAFKSAGAVAGSVLNEVPIKESKKLK